MLILFSAFEIKDSLLLLRWTFILAFIPGILAVLTIVFFVKESKYMQQVQEPLKFSLKSIDRNFKNYLLIMILFTLGNSSDAFLLFRVEESIQKSGAVVDLVSNIPFLNNMIVNFGNETEQARIINILFLPLVWAFFHIIKVVFSVPLGSLSDKIGRKAVINSGWGIYVCVYTAFALIVFLPSGLQVVATFILFAVYALFYAFTEGAERAFVVDLVSENKRGTAFGLFNFSIGLGALPASIIFGFLYSFFDTRLPGFGGTVAFGFGATLAFISMILLSVFVKEPVNKSNKY